MNNNTTVLPSLKKRIETGNLKFENDWTGLFIRGDEAFALSLELESILNKLDEKTFNNFEKSSLEYIVNLLKNTNENKKDIND